MSLPPELHDGGRDRDHDSDHGREPHSDTPSATVSDALMAWFRENADASEQARVYAALHALRSPGGAADMAPPDDGPCAPPPAAMTAAAVQALRERVPATLRAPAHGLEAVLALCGGAEDDDELAARAELARINKANIGIIASQCDISPCEAQRRYAAARGDHVRAIVDFHMGRQQQDDGHQPPDASAACGDASAACGDASAATTTAHQHLDLDDMSLSARFEAIRQITKSKNQYMSYLIANQKQAQAGAQAGAQAPTEKA